MQELTKAEFHKICQATPQVVATFEVVSPITFRNDVIHPGSVLWQSDAGLRRIGDHRGNIIPLIPSKIKFNEYKSKHEIDLMERLTR